MTAGRCAGTVTGVVTPYGHQAQATVEALRDQEGAATTVTEAGTAHRFQGREFPIVVFDLVEDEYDKRWMALAQPRGGSWERDGVRLFTVAVTRTQSRVYFIGSRRQIDRAPLDTPLHAVADLLRAGRGAGRPGDNVADPGLDGRRRPSRTRTFRH